MCPHAIDPCPMYDPVACPAANSQLTPDHAQRCQGGGNAHSPCVCGDHARSFIARWVRRSSPWFLLQRTNPGATPCGDGSHTVTNLRSYYFRTSSGSVIARLDMRYSAYCNTVWTRTVNLTSSRMTADSYVAVYSCPKDSCLVGTYKATGDVLPGQNASGWSHQLDLPAATSLNGARQPQAIRSVGWVTNGSVTALRVDMAREPMFTHLNYPEPWHNEPPYRDSDSDRFTCDNAADTCMSWGETSSGGPRTLQVFSGRQPPWDSRSCYGHGPGDHPAWNAVAADLAQLRSVRGRLHRRRLCPAGAEDRQRLRGQPNRRRAHHSRRNEREPNHPQDHQGAQRLTFDHACGTTDDGCTGSNNDDRPLIAHEWGHVYGLGHCDWYSAVMCHVTPSGAATMPNGNRHWVPQWSETTGLKAIYP